MAGDISIIIRAGIKGQREVQALADTIGDGFRKGKLAVEAFNAAAGRGTRIVSELRVGVGDLIKAYLSIETARRAFEGMLDVLKESQQAQFNMAMSVAAANREFSNTGSLEYWQQAVKELSRDLVVYSENAVKQAISRTIDMTKRLGFTADQMKELIKRTADLSAGKVDLEGGIERVTAAMRGEAEAAEYLGLTLNENYVKAWYNARGAIMGAWKDLTEMQKAQVRYQVFLEQTSGMQGRAAESAKTFSGALQMLRASIENAITNNRDLAEALKDVAEFIRENADEIGEMASELIEAVANMAKFVIEWKDILASLAAVYGVVKAVETLTSVLRGLAAAMETLRAIRVSEAILSVGEAAAEAMVLGVPFSSWLVAGLAVASACAADNIIKLVQAYAELHKWEKKAKEAEKERIEVQKRADEKARKLGESLGINISSMEEFNRLVDEGKIIWDDAAKSWKLAAEVLYEQGNAAGMSKQEFENLKGSIEDLGRAYEGLVRRVSRYFDIAAVKAEMLAGSERKSLLTTLEIYRQKTRLLLELAEQEAERKRALLEFSNANAEQAAEIEKQIAEDLKKAKIRTIEEWENRLKSALRTALSEEQKYAGEIKKLQEKLLHVQETTGEKIRRIRRSLMSEAEAWKDRQQEACETLSKAEEALWEGTEEGARRAQELARKAQDQFASLAGEVREGDRVVVTRAESARAAIEGIEKAGELLNEAIKKQIELAEQNRNKWQETASEIQTRLDDIKKMIDEISNTTISPTAVIRVDSAEVDAKLKELDGLVTHSTHIIHVREVYEKQSGGLMAAGGHLPGYGGGDRIHALLEAGEYVIRKEAVRRYGAAFFDALNNLRIDLPRLLSGMVFPDMKRFAAGGFVHSGETFTLKLQAGGVEMPLTVLGHPASMRTAIREFEKELSKLRLVRS